MRARWVSIRLDPTHPLGRLTEALRTGTSYDEVGAAPEEYLTSVYRCKSSLGLIYGDPLHQRIYKNLSDAKDGHRDVLRLPIRPEGL